MKKNINKNFDKKIKVNNLKKFINKFLIGDCLEIMKEISDNSIDLSITSPPYNKKEKNNGGLVKKIIYKNHVDNLDENEYQNWQIKILDEIYRITKFGGSFFYNHKIRYEKGVGIHPIQWIKKTKWKFKQEITWDRTITGNIRGWRFWQIDEKIYWLYKPRNCKDFGEELLSKHALLSSIWKITPERNNPHPAPFPLNLPTRIIYSIFDVKKDKIILDPFGGSGTTGIVSKYLKHNFISIDNSEEYTKLAVKRFKNLSFKEKKIIEKEINMHKKNKSSKDYKNENE